MTALAALQKQAGIMILTNCLFFIIISHSIKYVRSTSPNYQICIREQVVIIVRHYCLMHIKALSLYTCNIYCIFFVFFCSSFCFLFFFCVVFFFFFVFFFGCFCFVFFAFVFFFFF